MTTNGEKVTALQNRIRVAQEAKMRAEVAAQDAQARAKKAYAELEEQFGVVSTADAQAVLQQHQAELDAIIAKFTQALEEAGS